MRPIHRQHLPRHIHAPAPISLQKPITLNQRHHLQGRTAAMRPQPLHPVHHCPCIAIHRCRIRLILRRLAPRHLSRIPQPEPPTPPCSKQVAGNQRAAHAVHVRHRHPARHPRKIRIICTTPRHRGGSLAANIRPRQTITHRSTRRQAATRHPQRPRILAALHETGLRQLLKIIIAHRSRYTSACNSGSPHPIGPSQQNSAHPSPPQSPA